MKNIIIKLFTNKTNNKQYKKKTSKYINKNKQESK